MQEQQNRITVICSFDTDPLFYSANINSCGGINGRTLRPEIGNNKKKKETNLVIKFIAVTQ